MSEKQWEGFNYGDLEPFKTDSTIEACRGAIRNPGSAKYPSRKDIRQSAQRLLSMIEKHPAVVILQSIEALPQTDETLMDDNSQYSIAREAYGGGGTELTGRREHSAYPLPRTNHELNVAKEALESLVKQSYIPLLPRTSDLGDRLADLYGTLEGIDRGLPRQETVRTFAYNLQQGVQDRGPASSGEYRAFPGIDAPTPTPKQNGRSQHSR